MLGAGENVILAGLHSHLLQSLGRESVINPFFAADLVEQALRIINFDEVLGSRKSHDAFAEMSFNRQTTNDAADEAVVLLMKVRGTKSPVPTKDPTTLLQLLRTIDLETLVESSHHLVQSVRYHT